MRTRAAGALVEGVVMMMMMMGFLFPQTSIGQVSRVDVSSKVEVVWADNSMTIVLPQVRKRRP